MNAEVATLQFALLGVPVLVRSDHERILQRLAVCYEAATPHRGDRDVDCAIVVEDAGFVIRVTGRDDRRETSEDECVRGANHELMHAVMRRRPELFYVHAGVVAYGEHAIVIPGLSGAGKSTLVLASAIAGAVVLSDELLAYDPVAHRLEAFRRGVKIRDECVRYFESLHGSFCGAGEARYVRASALVAAASDVAVRARAIVIPKWGDRLELVPISRGRALLHLTESALNFGTHRERSIDHLTDLVAECACFELVFDEPHAAATAMRDTLASDQGG